MLCQLLVCKAVYNAWNFNRENVRKVYTEGARNSVDPDTTLLMHGGIGQGKLTAQFRSMQGFAENSRMYLTFTMAAHKQELRTQTLSCIGYYQYATRCLT